MGRTLMICQECDAKCCNLCTKHDCTCKHYSLTKTLVQGDKLDKTSFLVLACDVDDILERLNDQDDSDIVANEKLAQKLVDSQQFRSKFTDTIMNDFWETIDCLLMDDKLMEYCKK